MRCAPRAPNGPNHLGLRGRAGVIDMLEVRQDLFANKMLYEEFGMRYSALLKPSEKVKADGDAWEICQAVLAPLEGE